LLTAPFSGVVTARRADPGDLAAPGSPILTLLGGAELKVEIDLPGELAGTVAPGDVLPVVTPDPGSRLAARVVRVVPALDRESRRFRVEARFEDEAAARARITPGAYVRVELEDPSGTTRWVPEDVVVRRGQLQGVFAVEGERLRLRWIRPGQRRADAVEVLAGPPADALLVRDPPADLEDGRPVGSVRRVEWSPPAGRPVTPTPERAP
jgi:multidrug efflux pump subunit AcrA (membrane-fusion protein)